MLWRHLRPCVPYLVMASMTMLIAGLAVLFLPMHVAGAWRASRSIPWLDGLCRWDAGWFVSIAVSGYWFDPSRQSPVAFYPLYPLIIRALAPLLRSYFLSGIVVTWFAGLGVFLLFRSWVAARLDDAASAWAIAVLLLSPCSFYLFGIVYSDALFTVASLGAFVALERNRPWLAGVIGAAATAARPVGMAVVAGLIVRALERRGAFGTPGRRTVRLDAMAPADAGVLLSMTGAVSYWIFLWVRFGDPWAWIHAASAPGWIVVPGAAAWFKVKLFENVARDGLTLMNTLMLLHAVLLLAAAATLPIVIRSFGIGYAVYAVVVIAIPAVSSPDLFGMGRYILPAFPCLAAAGIWLARRPRLSTISLAASALVQATMIALFAAWYQVS